MVFSTLWAYFTVVKSFMGFTPFHLLYEVEFVLSIKCNSSTLHSTIELLLDTTPLEKRLVQLEHIDKVYESPFNIMNHTKNKLSPLLIELSTLNHSLKVS